MSEPKNIKLPRYIFLLAMVYFVALSVQAQQKVWEDESGAVLRRDFDGGIIMLTKDFSYKAKPTDFTLSGVYGEHQNVKFRFNGSCAPTVLVNVNMGRPELMGLEIGPNSSVSAKDFKLNAMLEAIKDAFLEQCPAIDNIRIQIRLPYIEPYAGQISKKNGWKLVDGFGQADDSYTFSINYRYGPYNKTGFQYEGPCRSEFQIELKPMYRSDSEAALSKSPKFQDYQATALEAIKKLTAQCSDVEEIKFKVDATPDSHTCPNGTECYLMAQKRSDWALSMMGYEFVPGSNIAMRTYNDVLKYLEKGDLDAFSNYTKYFGLFFEDYIYVYSEKCGKNIKNPITKTVLTYETTYDEQGYAIKKEEIRKPLDVVMEKEFEIAFENYFKSNKVTRFMKGVSYFFKANNLQFSNPVGDHMQYYRMNQYMIERFLNENCDSERAEKVKESILRLIE